MLYIHVTTFLVHLSYVISNNHATIAFSDTVLNIYIKTMTEDDDKEVVAQACMSVADIVKDCGFAAIEPCKLHCPVLVGLKILGYVVKKNPFYVFRRAKAC